MLNRLVRVVVASAHRPALLGVLLCACSGVPPIGGGAGGAGGTGGGGAAVVSPPDKPCAFVATPPTPTSNPRCPQGTYTGNVTIDGPEGIATLSGCTRIAGDLYVGGPTLQSIRGLESLLAVEGKVSLLVGSLPCPDPRQCAGVPRSPLLTSLRGLDELRCVGGDMGLLTASPPLLDAGGLAKLSDVEGSLQVFSFGPLQQALRALTRVYGDVDVPGPSVVPALTTVYGGVRTSAGPAQPGTFPRLSYIGCGSTHPPCRDGVLGCDFRVSGQTASQPLSACKYALKNVVVGGADLTSSAPLRQLRQVRGVLAIEGTGLSDLSGLTDLERIGAVSITDNAALRDVSALDGVTIGHAGKPYPVIPEPNGAVNEIGGGIKVKNNATLASLSWPNIRLNGPPGIQLVDNSVLTSFGSWPWLTEVSRLEIGGSPLTSVGGLQALVTAHAVRLVDLPNVTTLAGLDNLEQVEELELTRTAVTHVDALSKLTQMRDLGITSCRQLTSLSGLRSLNGVSGGLFFSDVPALTSLRGLEALRSADSFFVSGAGIADLTGLTNLGSAYRIVLDSCPRLTSLSGLARLTDLQALHLLHLPVFTSLAALTPVRTIATLSIEDLPALTTLSGLSTSPTVHHLELYRVPSLQSLRGLERTTQIGTLRIEDAASLQTLEGLDGLEEVGGSFNVGRTALHSLRALANLRRVNNGPGISANPRLSSCELRWLFERIGFTPPDYWTSSPRNCELTAPVTTPGLLSSKFFEMSNEEIWSTHPLPGDALAFVGTVRGEPVFTPPPGAPPALRPPDGTTATYLRTRSATGDSLTARLLDGFAEDSQHPRCSHVDASGRITIVVSEFYAHDLSQQTATFRFTSDGSLLASRREPALPSESCALDDTGNLYRTTSDAPRLRKQDVAGTVLWEKLIPAPAELGAEVHPTPHHATSGVLLQLGAPTATALSRVLDDGRVAWTRVVRGSVSSLLNTAVAADGQVTVLAVAQSSVSTDGGGGTLSLPAGASDLPFLLRLSANGSVASLRAFPELLGAGRIALAQSGSLYVISSGYYPYGPSTGAALFKFDASGNPLFKRDLGPLLAAWEGSSGLGALGLRVGSSDVFVTGQTGYEWGFLARFTP